MSPAEAYAGECGLWPGDAQLLLDRQVEVLELIARAAPLREVLGEILTALEELMAGGRCSVLLLDRERRTLHHGAAPSLPGEYVAAIDGMAIGDHAGSCGTAAALNTAIVAHDVRLDPRWADYRALADAAGLRSCWSTPIEGRDGLPVGTFAVYHPLPHRPTDREQLLVDRFTQLAAIAIDHAQLLGELVESEERFRRTFDDNALGMAIVGADRKVARSNTALTALAGGEPGPVGRPLADLLVPRGRDLAGRLDELDRGGTLPVTFEADLRRDDLPDLGVEATLSVLRGRDLGPAQFVVNVLDLTERRAAERHRRARVEAETARHTAEQVSRAKSELLTAVGHEARTPIQAIVGFAELLATLDLDPDRRREALDHIGAAAGHVMDLLTDVLDLSRIEADALPLALGPVPLRAAVEEVLGLLSSQAGERSVVLVADVDDLRAHADPRRLRQVLLNLVGNAVRHGRIGGRVTVRVRPETDGSAYLLVDVEDDGPGIPAEVLPHLFTPFVHAVTDPTARPDEDRCGLGLGLAHGLSAAMGGELRVARTSSSGTCMVLRIPHTPQEKENR